MSSPVLAGARLLGFSHRQKGQVVALDAATGRLLWAGPGRQGESASHRGGRRRRARPHHRSGAAGPEGGRGSLRARGHVRRGDERDLGASRGGAERGPGQGRCARSRCGGCRERRRVTMTMRRLAVVLALAGGGGLAGAQSWPQWGGPERDFKAVPAGRIAASWPAAGPRELWSRPLGEGYSAIVSDGATLFTMYRPIKGLADRSSRSGCGAPPPRPEWSSRWTRPPAGRCGSTPTTRRSFRHEGRSTAPGPHATPLIAGDTRLRRRHHRPHARARQEDGPGPLGARPVGRARRARCRAAATRAARIAYGEHRDRDRRRSRPGPGRL